MVMVIVVVMAESEEEWGLDLRCAHTGPLASPSSPERLLVDSISSNLTVSDKVTAPFTQSYFSYRNLLISPSHLMISRRVLAPQARQPIFSEFPTPALRRCQ